MGDKDPSGIPGNSTRVVKTPIYRDLHGGEADGHPWPFLYGSLAFSTIKENN